MFFKCCNKKQKQIKPQEKLNDPFIQDADRESEEIIKDTLVINVYTNISTQPINIRNAGKQNPEPSTPQSNI